MEATGKILFYNDLDGKGIIITPQKEKYDFCVQEWCDFDHMPSKGLEVSFQIENKVPKEIGVCKGSSSAIEKKKEISPIKKSQNFDDEQRVIKPQRYKEEELTVSEEELAGLLNNTNNSLSRLGKNIKKTMSISETMNNYFYIVDRNIQKRIGYKKVDGRLDYRLAKRFLWTTYNNLKEIDSHIITIRIKSVSDDLKQMGKLQEDFEKKVKYPAIAFEEIFLASQIEYKTTKIIVKKISEKLASLRVKEHSLDIERKKIQHKIKKEGSTEQKQQFEDELKVVSGTYVDIVHMIAKLQDEYSIQIEKMQEFEKKYRELFTKEFKKEAKRYEDFIVDIVNAQAYLLDFLLWKEAKTSKSILNHFKNLAVDIELNTKGYLKYYLSTLDESKINQGTKELFELYQHLQEIYRDYVLIITDDVHDAMELEHSIKSVVKNLGVKSFIDELQALKWAMTNRVKLIIITENLQLSTPQKFLDSYHNNIFSKPEIILLGSALQKHSKNYFIRKTLPRNASSKMILDSIKVLLETIENDE